MLVSIERSSEAQKLTLADFGDTPLACGLPPYPNALLVRVLADRLEHGVRKGDAMLVDRDGSIVAVLHNVHAIHPLNERHELGVDGAVPEKIR